MTSLSMSSRSSVWIERPPGVREVMGSIPVGDSDVFFVPRSCHVDQFTFHTSVTIVITLKYLLNHM